MIHVIEDFLFFWDKQIDFILSIKLLYVICVIKSPKKGEFFVVTRFYI